MTILSAPIANATATVALHRTLTLAGVERPLLLSHPLVQAMIMQTEGWRTMVDGLNAAAIRISDIDVDNLVGAATAEGALPAASTLTIHNVDVAAQRYAVLLQPTDSEQQSFPIMRLAQVVAAMDPEAPTEVDLRSVASLSQVMTYAWGNQLVLLLKAIVSSLGNTSGLAATDYSYAALRTAIKARRLAGATGRGLGLLLDAHGWSPVENDIISAGGAIVNTSMAQGVAIGNRTDMLKENVYQGTDILVTTGLPAVAADWYGGVFYPGCLEMRAYSTPAPSGTSRRTLLQTPFWTLYELGYQGGSTTSFELVFHMALSIQQAAMGFRILHD